MGGGGGGGRGLSIVLLFRFIVEPFSRGGGWGRKLMDIRHVEVELRLAQSRHYRNFSWLLLRDARLMTTNDVILDMW